MLIGKIKKNFNESFFYFASICRVSSRLCEKEMESSHRHCYMKTLEVKEQPPVKYIFYDLETSLAETVQKPMACFSQVENRPETFQKFFGADCLNGKEKIFFYLFTKRKGEKTFVF